MTFNAYPDADLLALDLANRLAGELETCLLTHESATLAVPGGTTPGPVFDALCAADLDWSRVHVLLTDERWVPQEHAQSNAALIRSRLMTSRAAAARFTPYYRPNVTPSEACEDVSAALANELPISVLVLGMGADMHTASLFPGAEGLAAALAPDARLLCPIKIPGQDISRVSLSAPLLQGALSKHLIILGAEKRAAFDAAKGKPAEIAPINAVLDDLTIHWAPA